MDENELPKIKYHGQNLEVKEDMADRYQDELTESTM
jgi:hypothetical protein